MRDIDDGFDVAIIGFGPTGATLAHLLGRLGLTVLVLEREGAPCRFPRAVHFDDEVMRVFQTIGISQILGDQVRVNPGMLFVDGAGRILLDWSRPVDRGRHGWNASYRFHQPDLERVLNDAITRYPNVHVRRRCEAFSINDGDDHVVLRYEDMATGRLHTASAAYVVGCDGARSLVRRFIGSDMEDLGYHERWLVVDVMLKTDRPDLGDHSIQFCDAERPITYARQPGKRRRWEIKLSPDIDELIMTQPERVWPLLARWITPEDADIERIAPYAFHSLVARRWLRGRLSIAGDAAHQTPPFMGQGMCAGIRDAANLAWKLARAITEQSDDALLDSYQSERLPNVRRYIETAVHLGSLIGASDPATALRLGQADENGVARMQTIVSKLGPGLGRGPNRGRLFGQPRLTDGELMDDSIGYAPVLACEASLAQNLISRPDLPVVTTDDAPDLAAELTAIGARAALLRPDRYVLATANTLEELGLLATSTEQLSPMRN